MGRRKFSINTNKKMETGLKTIILLQSVRPGEPQLNVVDGHKPVMDHTLGTMANHHRLVHMTQYELLKGKTEESAQHFKGGGEEGRT